MKLLSNFLFWIRFLNQSSSMLLICVHSLCDIPDDISRNVWPFLFFKDGMAPCLSMSDIIFNFSSVIGSMAAICKTVFWSLSTFSNISFSDSFSSSWKSKCFKSSLYNSKERVWPFTMLWNKVPLSWSFLKQSLCHVVGLDSKIHLKIKWQSWIAASWSKSSIFSWTFGLFLIATSNVAPGDLSTSISRKFNGSNFVFTAANWIDSSLPNSMQYSAALFPFLAFLNISVIKGTLPSSVPMWRRLHVGLLFHLRRNSCNLNLLPWTKSSTMIGFLKYERIWSLQHISSWDLIISATFSSNFSFKFFSAVWNGISWSSVGDQFVIHVLDPEHW